MARPRQFDEKNAVRSATELFWRRGYHATSVRDLGDELKLTPSSLYRTFTDKHTLFLRALDHYRATDSAEAQQRLDTADRPVRQVLREWMLWLVTCPADGKSGRGCFVVNTATEPRHHRRKGPPADRGRLRGHPAGPAVRAGRGP